jgi:hypothetical protein
MKGIRGPNKTILIGETMVDTTLLQTPWLSDPKKDSGCRFRMPVVKKIKANPKMRKRLTNAVVEIFIPSFV